MDTMLTDEVPHTQRKKSLRRKLKPEVEHNRHVILCDELKVVVGSIGGEVKAARQTWKIEQPTRSDEFGQSPIITASCRALRVNGVTESNRNRTILIMSPLRNAANKRAAAAAMQTDVFSAVGNTKTASLSKDQCSTETYTNTCALWLTYCW